MFEQYAPTSLDTPKQLESLYGLSDLGLAWIPFLIAGSSAAATATIGSWMGTNWDRGTYNIIVRKIDDTIKHWDQQAWGKFGGPNCWRKYPAKRKEWLAFWRRWSKHYGKYGQQHVYLSDEAENPVRNIFLPEMQQWANWFNTACKMQTTAVAPASPTPPPSSTEANGSATGNIATAVKWGAIGVGGILLMNIVSGIRGALPRQPQ